MIKKSPLSFCRDWRETVRFIEYSYNDFVSFLMSSKEKFYFSQKIDGELNALIYEKDKTPYFITKSGVIHDRDYSVLREYREVLDKTKIENCVIIGELVALEGKKQYPFARSQSVIQTGDVNLVHHFVFDIYELNSNLVWGKYRFPELEKMLNTQHIHEPKWVHGGINEFKKLWDLLVIQGKGEGIVARNPDKPKVLYRIKNVQTVDCAVVAIGKELERAWNKHQMGYLRLAFLNESGNFILTAKVGTGFSSKIRSEMFQWGNNNFVEKKSGELWVPPVLVVEVKYRRYRKSKLPLLKYEDKQYKVLGVGEGVMMDQVSFVRFRNDKVVDYKDISINQFPNS